MGTTSQKLTYLNETKGKIKDGINSIGGELTTEPFREYVEELEGIYENLPKVNGEGASLSLSPTNKGRMKIELKGNTNQESTTGKNKANIYVISNFSGGAFKRTVENGTITIWDNTNTSGYSTTEKKLSQICPNLQVGDSVKLTFTTTFGTKYIYLSGKNITWSSGSTKTIDQDMLDSIVALYGGYQTTTVISEFMIRLSSITDNTYEPYTNGASPNPDYPQDIQVVSGDNTLKVSGENQFDKDNPNVIEGYIAKSNATIYLTNNQIIIYVRCKPNTKYCVRKELASTPNNNVFRIGTTSTIPTGGSVISQFYVPENEETATDYTFTTNANAQYIVWYCYVRESFDLIKNGVYIGECTTYPINLGEIELCKIGTYQDNIAKSSGKNLFDIGTSNSDYDNLNNTAPSYLTVSGNTLSMVVQGGGSTRFYRKQNLEGNNTFTINSTTSTNEARYFVRIRKLDDSGWMTNSDYTFTSGWSYNQYYSGWYINVRGGNNDETFTIPECLYWQIGFGWDTNIFQETTQTMSNIMINEGTTALPYEPYGTSWYLEKKIGKKVYKGEESEQWGPYTTHVFGSQPITEIRNCLSNFYIFNSTEFMGQLSNGQFGIANASNQYALCVRDDRFDTATELKVWLNTHYLSIYYPLNKPTYETITDTTLLSQLNALGNANSYNNQTNINQDNNDLASILSVSALLDANTYIDHLEAQVEALS